MRKLFYLIFSYFITFSAFAADFNNLDSLETVLHTLPNDTIKADIYAELAYKKRTLEKEKAEFFINKSLLLAHELNNDNLVAKGLSIKSILNYQQGKYKKALALSFQALDVAKKNNLHKRFVYIHNDIANIYVLSGVDPKKALEHYKKAIEYAKKLKMYEREAISLANIGETYNIFFNDHKLAIDYTKRAVEIRKKHINSDGIAVPIGNIGVNYYKLNMLDSALIYFQTVLDLKNDKNYSQAIVETYYYIAKIYMSKENYEQAQISLSKSVVSSKNIKDNESLIEAYEEFALVNYELKNYKVAYMYKDSASNIQKVIEDESNLSTIISEYEEKESAKELELVEKEKELAKIELAKTRQIQVFTLITLVLLVCFILYGYSKYKIIKKQKNVITIQRDAIEQSQKDFQNSLEYASIIQGSILPTREKINKSFEDYFVFFKPLHTVSGDFYYFVEKEDRVYVAVADCTGHGVPGAFMSMIGYEILNYIINTMNVKEPNRILARLNDRIYRTLKQEEGSGMDGMDLALVCVYKNENRMEVACAGSNVMIFNENRKGGELVLKRNRFGVGSKFNVGAKYTQEEVELLKGDTIYLGSDGYVDQFGGDRGKKFKMKKLKDLLKEIHNEGLFQQKKKIENTFYSWKKDYQQVDDVTVFGFVPKIVEVEEGKLEKNQIIAIEKALADLLQLDLSSEITEAIEILENVEINNVDWVEMYNQLTELILGMEADKAIHKIKEILKDL